ncbi:MerR family transcriptional regulator [Brevundimonas naejangsanensis]
MSQSTPKSRSIGRLSAATGVKVPTIRFYEKIGLLPQPERNESDYRMYDNAAFQRLAFIRHARQLGFEMDAIRSLLDLADDPARPCAEANRIAERQLAAVEAKIEGLEALRTELQRMQVACAGGRVSDCRVIEALSDPLAFDRLVDETS